MKTSIACLSAFAAAALAATSSAPTTMPTPVTTSAYTPHHMHTMTNKSGYTILYDEANTDYGVFMAGITSVDGIYATDEAQPHQGTDTWVDVDDGNYAIIDYEHPNHYTVYNSDGEPIATIGSDSQPTTKPTYCPPDSGDCHPTKSHYLMTFIDQHSNTALVDKAVPNVFVLEGFTNGADGIYTVPSDGYHGTNEATDIGTWVDSKDGLTAILDYAHPNTFTVYNTDGSPVETIRLGGDTTPTPTTTRWTH